MERLPNKYSDEGPTAATAGSRRQPACHVSHAHELRSLMLANGGAQHPALHGPQLYNARSSITSYSTKIIAALMFQLLPLQTPKSVGLSWWPAMHRSSTASCMQLSLRQLLPLQARDASQPVMLASHAHELRSLMLASGEHQQSALLRPPALHTPEQYHSYPEGRRVANGLLRHEAAPLQHHAQADSSSDMMPHSPHPLPATPTTAPWCPRVCQGASSQFQASLSPPLPIASHGMSSAQLHSILAGWPVIYQAYQPGELLQVPQTMLCCFT